MRISHCVSNVTTNMASGVLQKIETNNSTTPHHSKAKTECKKWTPCPYNYLIWGKTFTLYVIFQDAENTVQYFCLTAYLLDFNPMEVGKFSYDKVLYKIISI